MALARLDVPALMLYGGSIPPGRFQGHDVTIQDVFEAVGAHASGSMSDAELAELESVASPGAGACGGQFTANTMAMAYEMLGISPIGDSLMPAQEPTKPAVARASGALVVDVLRRGLRPSAMITRHGLENAITAIAASGGSTNGVLHLLALAREAGVELEIDDFDAISERTPLLCDLKPGGRFVASTSTVPAASPCWPSAWRRRASCMRTRPRLPARRWARSPPRRGRHPAAGDPPA